MSRRPTRLIRLAQQLATRLGLDIDHDADIMSEEDLRSLLNAAIDYVESVELERQQQRQQALPNIIGTGTSGPYTWTTHKSPYTATYAAGGGGGSGTYTYRTNSDQLFSASVNA